MGFLCWISLPLSKSNRRNRSPLSSWLKYPICPLGSICLLIYLSQPNRSTKQKNQSDLARFVSHPFICISFYQISLVLRLRHHLRNGFSSIKPSESQIITLGAFNSNRLSRNFSQPAKQEQVVEEEKEVEIDQRRIPADYHPSNFDPTEHRTPPTERVWRLVDEISGLTLSETAELGSVITKKRGMTEPPTVGVMKAGAAADWSGMATKVTGGAAAAKEEKKPDKTVFELKLESNEAASKIKIIKEVRSFTDLGLKQAKDLVEKTPFILKKGVSKEEGELISEKMKAVGAKVVLE
ncbi:uncharacterized protein LOC111282931 isoform X1 [Durio zibethinus]|uniref:Uncharacterized protein LOC111282931 isoform X1 n=1 Tax=Durio zibethinus TaxID=66656 RepID=A0A6P5XGT7_DURZI|nr:uncharacterized protein LOC111282931 isoform X1 [Durio zibethinus]